MGGGGGGGGGGTPPYTLSGPTTKITTFFICVFPEGQRNFLPFFGLYMYIYIYTCRKTCIKSLCPLTAGGGGGNALADASARNASFFV